MEHYADLITRSVMIVVEALAFTYYLVTARKFLMASVQSEKRDTYTLVMIALLTESLFVRISVILPSDLLYLVRDSASQDPSIPYYMQPAYDNKLVSNIAMYLIYSPQRIATIVNLARWVVLYFSLP